MTVWKVDHKSNVPVFPHNSTNGAKLWDCGYDYYFFYGGLGVVEEVILHVLNDGNQTLTLSAPQLVNAGPEFSIDLLGLAGNVDIAPNHELQIIVRYVGPAAYSNSSAELVLTSNDPDAGTCSFEFEVGATATTLNDDGDVIDPCNCNDVIPFMNSFLFIDTLVITATLMVNVILENNFNPNGFLDNLGNPIIATPIPLGLTTNIGGVQTLKFPFWRRPNEPVNIELSIGAGMPFRTVMSPACTDECNFIPTLSQWGLIVTFLLLLIAGVAAVKVKRSQSTLD